MLNGYFQKDPIVGMCSSAAFANRAKNSFELKVKNLELTEMLALLKLSSHCYLLIEVATVDDRDNRVEFDGRISYVEPLHALLGHTQSLHRSLGWFQTVRRSKNVAINNRNLGTTFFKTTVRKHLHVLDCPHAPSSTAFEANDPDQRLEARWIAKLSSVFCSGS